MMNKIEITSNLIVDYYSEYQDGYIGDTYNNRDEAISDIKDLLNVSPKGQIEEILDEINHVIKNEDLRKFKNIKQLDHAFAIALCINEVMYDKEKELGE